MTRIIDFLFKLMVGIFVRILKLTVLTCRVVYRLSGFCAMVIGFFLVYSIMNPPGSDIDPNLPAYGTFSPKTEWVHHGLIKLSRDGGAFCSAFVIDDKYAMTAAHCLDAGLGLGLNRKPLNILLENGTDSGVVATPVGMNNRVDVGLIMGDFSKFIPYRVDFYGFSPTNKFGDYRTCGYPYLQNKVTCTVFKPQGNSGFSLVGSGFLIPGMSGGPVIDIANGYVMGVNSAMGNGAYIAPTLGALGTFGIEP